MYSANIRLNVYPFHRLSSAKPVWLQDSINSNPDVAILNSRDHRAWY